MKKNIGYALLVFVVISIAFAIFQKNAPAPRTESKPDVKETTKIASVLDPAPTPMVAQSSKRSTSAIAKLQIAKQIVIARYCHGYTRCSNCLKIEQYSREAIETRFRKELDLGRLRFEVVNVEEPTNRHYIQDYGLYTKSLVLIAETSGKEVRHKVLNDVWNHLSDKAAFMAYVRAETERFLESP